MEIWLKISELTFQFLSEIELTISSDLKLFCIEKQSDFPDVSVHIKRSPCAYDFRERRIDGKDLIQTYYHDDFYQYCVLMEGDKGALICTAYDEKMSDFHVSVDDTQFIRKVDSLDKIMRGLPLKAIFQKHGIIFLHSAQIGMDDESIVFTAPSGTGKTTQANLWVEEEQAKAITADRTLIRKINGQWMAYNFPIDGSAPIHLNCRQHLKAVIALGQHVENKAIRLSPAKAVAFLMDQLIIDTWNLEARRLAMNQLLELVTDIPILYFLCTKEKDTVKYLKSFLRKEEIF